MPNRAAAVCIAIALTLPGVAGAQTSPPAPQASASAASAAESIPSPQADATRRNQQAQAEYYNEQLKHLREPSFWDRATPYGVVLTVLASLAALVVNSLIQRRTQQISIEISRQTQEASIRSLQDTQFYEALKRLGDPDSPVPRASASGLLTEMVNRRPEYAPAVIDQLVMAIPLESNDVVLTQIDLALERIASRDYKRTLAQLQRVIPLIKQEIAQISVDLLVTRGVSRIPEMFGDEDSLPPNEQRLYNDWLVRLEQLTGISGAHLEWLQKECLRRARTDDTLLLRSAHVGGLGSEDKDARRVQEAKLEQALTIAATRLRFAVVRATEVNSAGKLNEWIELSPKIFVPARRMFGGYY